MPAALRAPPAACDEPPGASVPATREDFWRPGGGGRMMAGPRPTPRRKERAKGWGAHAEGRYQGLQ